VSPLARRCRVTRQTMRSAVVVPRNQTKNNAIGGCCRGGLNIRRFAFGAWGQMERHRQAGQTRETHSRKRITGPSRAAYERSISSAREAVIREKQIVRPAHGWETAANANAP